MELLLIECKSEGLEKSEPFLFRDIYRSFNRKEGDIMEFIRYLSGGIIDLIVFIIIILLSPFIRVIDSKKLNTFVNEILTKIFSEEGLF